MVHVFGKDENYDYRIETRFGGINIVAATVKTVDIPKDRLADEHIIWHHGEKIAVATTVTAGVFLGAEVCSGFTAKELEKGYGVFATETKVVEPEYVLETVSTDNDKSTVNAWRALYPLAVILCCFLHAWLSIRERGKKQENFHELSGKVWDIYRSETEEVMLQKIKDLRDWANENFSGVVLEKTLALCDKSEAWRLWYDKRCKKAYRTSNMLDRVMRSMNCYFDRGQQFHGTQESANRRSRAWAILYNYFPWCRKTIKDNGGCRCPAERLNGKRYAENWLENLLIATSAVPKANPAP